MYHLSSEHLIQMNTILVYVQNQLAWSIVDPSSDFTLGVYLSLIYILCQVVYTFLRLFNEFPHFLIFPF